MKVIFVIGMAGSGKTTLVSTCAQLPSTYIVNLDPAVQNVPYSPNVDIRDSINYMELQEQNHLGPNGAIMTALALYASKISSLISLCKQAVEKNKYENIIIDAPGQIEVFAWSASGELLIDYFSRNFPTAVVYLADAKRAAMPNTFVSGMLYFMSVKQHLSLGGKILVCYNKADLLTPNERDRLEKFGYDSLELLDSFENPELMDEDDYSLAFLEQVVTELDSYWLGEEFHIVSAVTGDGLPEMYEKLEIIAEKSYKEHQKAADDVGRERLEAMDKALGSIEVVLEKDAHEDEGNLDGVD